MRKRSACWRRTLLFAVAALTLGTASGVRASVLDPFYGFGRAVGYGLGFAGPGPGGGIAYGLGAGLGATVTGVVGVSADVVSTPFTVVGSLVGAVPGVPVGASDALVQNPLRRWAHEAETRTDRFAETHPNPFTILADDVMATGSGVLGHVRGFGDSTGMLLGGMLSLRPKRALGGFQRFVVTLVPRYGRFAGPGHGGQSQRAFWDAPDVNSKVHDADYAPGSGLRRWEADRKIVRALGRSFLTWEQQPGPWGQVYRVLEIGLFAAKAPIEKALAP